ncbi:hypothetical protein AQUCO_01600170v1 [Aquilegia coerulea]|uniref:MATH domain-containing protein n=1 Tax=Aquilegia coerulea TaxID=218851 RepID=A0A2G5DQD4_AQUCA|nr:hypothetical protein AQUCO_01600170v1 [Aquilegia coerulea]PIA45736.1 hypothetical protein AQUCO_01600170v1 [Aquilegia coerulea]
MASSPIDDPAPYEARTQAGDQPNLNLTYKIESLSLLYTNNSPEVISSLTFAAGDYAWKFLVFPKGPPQDHMTFGLVLDGTRDYSILPVGSKVDAKFNVYLYNHIKGNFIKVAENQGSSIRFEGQKLKTRASPSLSLGYLSNPSHGYLLCDECIFGVEVLVCDDTYQCDCLSTIKGAVPVTFTWKMNHFKAKFLKLQKERVGKTPTFKVGDYDGVIMYFAPEYRSGTLEDCPVRLITNPGSSPKSISETEDRFFSLYIFFSPKCLEESDQCSKHINVKVVLRIKDQSTREEHIQREATRWIGKEMLGWPKFIELSLLTDPNKGYLVDDKIIIEAEVVVLASIKRSYRN